MPKQSDERRHPREPNPVASKVKRVKGGSRLQFLSAIAGDPEQAAKGAGLLYVSDHKPGIARQKVGAGFRYVDAAGHVVREADLIARFRSLAIPPAWRSVWICPDPRGHIQATGRDARGRKQYRYHPQWREIRDEVKYGRMISFASALPLIRERARGDVARSGMPREKVIAAVIQLLERTLIRIGNDEYARQNSSFGLTTLRERHVTVEGKHIHFHFRGKSGKEHAIDLDSPRLAAIVRKCQELPGQELFHFRDAAGDLHPIGSSDVNAYLREAAGADFTAKDFRTWHGTLLAARACSVLGTRGGKPTKKLVAKAVEQVAAKLGNTPSVCRKNYIHPAILARFMRGEFGPAEAASLVGDDAESAMVAILNAEASRADTPMTTLLTRSVVSARRRKSAAKRAA